jgi:hypothetical protein
MQCGARLNQSAVWVRDARAGKTSRRGTQPALLCLSIKKCTILRTVTHRHGDTVQCRSTCPNVQGAIASSVRDRNRD